MKIKSLLLTGVLGVAGVASTIAQTNTNYSQNTVGYVNLSFQPGFSMIANPLLNTTNDAQSILTNVPNGTILFELGAAGVPYVATGFTNGVWSPLDDVLNPGGGALLYLPQQTTINFVGTVPQGNLSNTIPAGLSIQSVLAPISLSLTNSAVNFPIATGDTIYRFNNASGQFAISTYAQGRFQPVDAVPAVGESFFVLKAAATNWSLPFVVNDVTPRRWSNENALGLDAAPAAFAQGTVNFCNLAGSLLNQPVLASGGGPLDPADLGHFMAELSAGPDAAHLTPIPSSITPIVDGQFFGGSVTVPNPATNGTVALQVLAWDGSTAATYAAAVSAGAATGQSAVFSISVSLAAYPVPPATMTPLQSFVVQPPGGSSTNLGPLTIAHIGTNVVVSWSATTNTLLQESAPLNKTNWLDIPTTLGLGKYTNAVATTNTFYRTIAR